MGVSVEARWARSRQGVCSTSLDTGKGLGCPVDWNVGAL